MDDDDDTVDVYLLSYKMMGNRDLDYVYHNELEINHLKFNIKKLKSNYVFFHDHDFHKYL